MEHPRREALRAYLEEAVKLTQAASTKPVYAERVNLIRQGYQRLDLFLDITQEALRRFLGYCPLRVLVA